MRRLALPVALLAFALPAAPAGAAVPLAKARVAAAKRLFAYVYPLSYVIDYRLTGCTRDGETVTCAYRVGFYTGTTCTGTITVDAGTRSLVTKIAGPPCAAPVAPTEPTPTAGSGTSSQPTFPTFPTLPTTPSPGTTTPTAPVAPGGYTGVSDNHALAAVSADDSTVTLADGSRWLIASDGQGIVAAWTVSDNVIVQAGAASTYTLVDTDTYTNAVSATYLGS